MSEVLQFVSNRLRTFRVQSGLTQEALAEKSGLHNTYIGQVERGEKNLTLGSLEKILKAMDISFSDLFDGYEEKKKITPVDYPQLCYEIVLSRGRDDQRHLYEILNSINMMIR